MYANIKSRIMNTEDTSAYFACLNGVRRGENVSPFLYSIFLNDLEHYFSINYIPGIECEINENEIYVFLKVFLLLYAYDTVIFGEDASDLQTSLCMFENYCKTWKLKVNIPKTKVLMFSKGRPKQNLHFFYDDSELEIVNEYKYLGILLSRSGSFSQNKKYLAQQANHEGPFFTV